MEFMIILLLNLLTTVLAYLLVPGILCIKGKKYKKSTIKKIVIINGAVVWLLFQIIRIQSGNEGTSAAVILWSSVAYWLMKKRCLIQETDIEQKENVEETDNQTISMSLSDNDEKVTREVNGIYGEDICISHQVENPTSCEGKKTKEREEKGVPKKPFLSKRNIILLSALVSIGVLSIGGIFGYKKIMKPMKQYKEAVELYEKGDYGKSYFAFMKIYGYKDSVERINEISNEKLNRQIIAAAPWHTVAVKKDGKVIAAGNLSSGKCKVSKWRDIVSVSAGQYHTVGLKKDGTVVATCDKGSENCCKVSKWNKIIAISAGTFHTVGLKADGTVVAVGDNNSGECNVSFWEDIVEISAGSWITVGLKKDGTVVSTKSIPELSKWKNITKVYTDGDYIVGFNGEGKMLVLSVYPEDILFGEDSLETLDISKFEGVTQFVPFVGLKKDGTIVANGYEQGQYDYKEWTDIIAISAFDHIAAVKSDGTVLSTIGWNEKGQCDVYHWTNVGYYKYK